MKKTERKSKYWICRKCAFKNKLTIATTIAGPVTTGLCGHCDTDEEVHLNAMLDYRRGSKMVKEVRDKANHVHEKLTVADALKILYGDVE